jgi:hypothetical protein
MLFLSNIIYLDFGVYIHLQALTSIAKFRRQKNNLGKAISHCGNTGTFIIHFVIVLRSTNYGFVRKREQNLPYFLCWQEYFELY